MTYEVLSLEDHENFRTHYNFLRDKNKIKEVLDQAAIFEFWNKNPDKHFEAALLEQQNFNIGVIESSNKKFVIGVKDNKICLLDDLNKFLKIK